MALLLTSSLFRFAMNRFSRHGFTLIELLSVVAILALLLAILIPATLHSRNKARQTRCLSHLHNIAQAFSLYRMDYDGYFPLVYAGTVLYDKPGRDLPGKHWPELLQPYLKTDAFFFCPARQSEPGTTIPDDVKFQFSGYMYNRHLGDLTVSYVARETVYHTVQEAQLHRPSRTVCVAEARIGLLAGEMPDVSKEDIFREFTVISLPVEHLKKQPMGGVRHDGGGNYLFVDGHTRWHSPADFRNVTDFSPTFARFLQ